jgi:hypothetical protein
MEAPQKPKIELPEDPAMSLLGTYPRECKSRYNTLAHPCLLQHSICNSQAMETSQMPTTDEWIKKMLYIYILFSHKEE